MQIGCRLLSILVVLASMNSEALANEKAGACSQVDAIAAGNLVDELRDWAAVAHFYDRFRRCDDGGTSEGVSDAIAKLLVRKQPEVDALLRLERARRGLSVFVLRHIDGTLDDNDLKIIAEQLPRRCESDARRMCGAISRAAVRALSNP